NANIFPDPLVFNPDWWLKSSSADLTNYLVSFSRGSRMCLAWCELYLFFSHLFC
ncbi:hypothetical protein B0H34DRAFT_668585, partial [Crassisporium funariophilum]